MPDNDLRLPHAQKLCEQRGVRFTAVREQVFKLLAASNTAVGAYDLLQQLQQIDPKAKPPTVYRALDFLIEQGFVHKVESDNAFVLCVHFEESHYAQLLICDSCGDVKEIGSKAIEQELQQAASQSGFKITKPTVEAHGLCKKCQPCQH